MSLDLYYIPASAPCRSVLAVGKELNLEFNLKLVNLMEKEQLKPEYLAINPQHCVPTIVDNDEDGFALWESRAILKYLVDKVSPGHTLYPSDLKTRATIDRWLYFDIGSLYPALAPILYPILMAGAPLDESKVPALKDKLKVLDDALEGKKYLVTENRTIADLAILSTVTTSEVVDGLDFSEFVNLKKWSDGLKEELPYYAEVNQSGLDALKEYAAKHKKE